MPGVVAVDSPKVRLLLLLAFALGLALLESRSGRCERCAAIHLPDQVADPAAR